jgi:histone deacetylase 8
MTDLSWDSQISALLPSNKKRSMIVHSLVSALGLMKSNASDRANRRLQVVAPRKASYKDLAVYHTRDYLDAVLDVNKADEEQETEVGINAEFGLEDACLRESSLLRLLLIRIDRIVRALLALQSTSNSLVARLSLPRKRYSKI